MKTLKMIAAEIWGLFVDDGSLAIAILIWISLVALAIRYSQLGRVAGLVLAAGLLMILFENVRRSARKSRQKQVAHP